MADRTPPSKTPEPPRMAFLGALTSDLLSAEGAQRYQAPSCSPLRAPFGTRYAARLGGLLTQSIETTSAKKKGPAQ